MLVLVVGGHDCGWWWVMGDDGWGWCMGLVYGVGGFGVWVWGCVRIRGCW